MLVRTVRPSLGLPRVAGGRCERGIARFAFSVLLLPEVPVEIIDALCSLSIEMFTYVLHLMSCRPRPWCIGALQPVPRVIFFVPIVLASPGKAKSYPS
jgi:hypothetical protein